MKKDSQTIHRNHAEQKAAKGRERERAGYKGKSQKLWRGKTEANPLTNPFAQLLAFDICSHNRQAQSKPKAYEHRRR